MSRGEPLYKSRRVGPAAAEFGRCERINDFICLSEANSNSYLLETSEGNVLVNTGMGFEAPVLQKNFESLSDLSDGSIKYAIATQGHVDHIGGMQYFRDRNPGLSFISTDANDEHTEYDKRLQAFRSARSAFRFIDDFMAVFQRYADAGYRDLNQQDSPKADITFADTHSLTLGGLEIELIAQPGAETNDSLIIWLPQHKICFTGNLFGCPFGHFPNLITIRGDRYRDAMVCANAVQRVMDLKPEMILYGHHEPIVGSALIQAELTALKNAIEYVHDETVKGMNAGKDVHTLQQEISIPAEFEVGEGYGKVSWSVRAIWENYAGWFHHSSTTELYSVPQSSVHADLVELAGADALLARARKRFDNNEREQALHLIDIVRNAEPENQDAIALSIEVHEQLLKDAEQFKTTGNFWLTGWLENQLKLLRGGQERSLSSVIK